MRFVDIRDGIFRELRRTPSGLTWRELQARLDLPYERPCPTWVSWLEAAGMTRTRGSGRALVWKVPKRRDR